MAMMWDPIGLKKVEKPAELKEILKQMAQKIRDQDVAIAKLEDKVRGLQQ